MAKRPSASHSRKGLATIALLKVHYDAGEDHIGMFIPFVADAVRQLGEGPSSPSLSRSARAINSLGRIDHVTRAQWTRCRYHVKVKNTPAGCCREGLLKSGILYRSGTVDQPL